MFLGRSKKTVETCFLLRPQRQLQKPVFLLRPKKHPKKHKKKSNCFNQNDCSSFYYTVETSTAEVVGTISVSESNKASISVAESIPLSNKAFTKSFNKF